MDPVIGRFISVDPLLVETPDKCGIQECNLYSYARNNPLVRIDPSGKFTVPLPPQMLPLFKPPPYVKPDSNSGRGPWPGHKNVPSHPFGSGPTITSKPMYSPTITTLVTIIKIKAWADNIFSSEGNSDSIPKKQRNKPPTPDPRAEGAPHSIIERPGSKGQYTTHYGDGTWKQFRGSGKSHGSIPRPNVKENSLNTLPDGTTRAGKPLTVRPPEPQEIPGD